VQALGLPDTADLKVRTTPNRETLSPDHESKKDAKTHEEDQVMTYEEDRTTTKRAKQDRLGTKHPKATNQTWLR
jgi:hypothetical protein